MIILELKTKTGFLSEMKSRDKSGFSGRMRLLRVDLSAQETRFFSISKFDYLFTKLVKLGFWEISETRFFHHSA
jgi:hypothetical protein